MTKSSSSFKKTGAALISFAVVFLLWYLATAFTQLGTLLPGPVTVIRSFVRSFYVPIGTYTILGHTFWSLSRVLIAFVAASLAGVLLGLAMGWSRIVESLFRPIFEIIRPIPPIAWIPLAILWFGLGEMTKYFLIFLTAFSSVTLNAYTGVKTVDPSLIGAAKTLGASNRQLFRTVVMPATVPYIFSGLQIAISGSWATVVAAEMVRSSEGLGWIIVTGKDRNDLTQVMVGIIAIGLVGSLLVTVMRIIEEKLCAWNRRQL